jgi:hypothetical protein
MLRAEVPSIRRCALPDGCVDCNVRPRPNDVVPCYSETFPMTTIDGGRFTVTLRLCLACGTRFADRAQLRRYLATRLPAYATSSVAVSYS